MLEIAIILLLIFANGLLAMSEIAVVSSRPARLQQRAEAGDHGAETALQLAADSSRFLSTVQIGITLVGILAGAFGGASVADRVKPLLDSVPALRPYSAGLSVGLVVAAIAYLSLVLGELAPKQVALAAPERIASGVAQPMLFLARLAAPVVSLLAASTTLVLRLFRVRASTEPAVTEEEVRILIEQGTDAGIFEPEEEQMVGKVFRFADRRVGHLTTPRPDIIWLDLADDPDALRQKILAGPHSHFPVAEGDLENVLGFARANDLLAQCLEGKPLDIRGVLQPALLLPESMPALDALERFRQTRAQIALALDEFGGIAGLLSLRDILEAIVGDLPEAQEAFDPDIVERQDGSYLLNGMLPVEELKALLRVDRLPGDANDAFRTTGGFVMAYLGKIPKPGDRFELDSYSVEVVDMDGLRVDKVLVSRRPAA